MMGACGACRRRIKSFFFLSPQLTSFLGNTPRCAALLLTYANFQHMICDCLSVIFTAIFSSTELCNSFVSFCCKETAWDAAQPQAFSRHVPLCMPSVNCRDSGQTCKSFQTSTCILIRRTNNNVSNKIFFFHPLFSHRGQQGHQPWAIIATRLWASCLLIKLLPNITSTVLWILWTTVSRFSRRDIYARSWHIRAWLPRGIFHVSAADWWERNRALTIAKQRPLSPSCCQFLVQLLRADPSCTAK